MEPVVVRARRTKRLVTVTLGVVALTCGVLGVATLPTGWPAQPNAVVGYLAAALLFRFGRRFRPATARSRVASVLLLVAGVAMLVGAGWWAARPVHGYFSDDLCGSALRPRAFAGAEFDCEEAIAGEQFLALGLLQLGAMSLFVFARRPRRYQPHRVLLVGAVSLSMLGVTAVPALATQREVKFVESLRESKAARPVADEVCKAMANWGRGVGARAGELHAQVQDASVAQTQAALVAFISGARADADEIVATINEMATRYRTVAGVTELLGYLRPPYVRLAQTFADSEKVMRTQVRNKRELAAVQQRATDVLKSFDIGSPADVLPPRPSKEAAEVLLAFEHSLECLGIF